MNIHQQLFRRKKSWQSDSVGKKAPRRGGHPLGRALFLSLSLLLLLQACARTAQQRPLDKAEPTLEGFHRALVSEPVFNSQAFILEGGNKQAKTVLMVHGLGDMGSDAWRHQLLALAERYHVIAFDLPGFGRSEKKSAQYSPAQYAVFLKWVVDNYVQGPFILIGHSLGGAIALYYTGTYQQKPEKLILADVAGILDKAALLRQMLPPSNKQTWPINVLYKLFDKLILSANSTSKWFPLDVKDLVENEGLRTYILGDNPAKIAAINLIQTDFSPLFHEIQIPTLILWGENDSVTPLRTGILLEGSLNNSRLQTIPQAGHVPMLDQPETFNREVIKFITVSPMRPPLSIPLASGDGICRDQADITFAGSYRNIQVTNCQNVKLDGVAAESVEIIRSTVFIEKTVIKGKKFGLIVRDSTVTGTSLTVEADHALETSQSSFDLAGTLLIGRKTAIRSEDSDNFIFSVSQVKSPISTQYMHGMFKVIAQTPL